MNELLAIVIIVIVCCAIFFAWLLSMATCPDKMVNWLSGTTGNTTCATSYESKELIAHEEAEREATRVTSARGSASDAPSLLTRLSSITKRSTPKKLSVVPEQDEQLTVTSISQILFPTNEVPSGGGVVTSGVDARHRPQLASFFECAEETAEQGLGDINSQIIVESPAEEYDEQTQLGELPLRYHFSAPVIHVV